jgi:hypothetical protein
MKWLLRTFALFDIICLVLLWQQFTNQISSFTSGESLTGIVFFSRLLFIITWLSLVVSGFLLLKPNKWGIYIYFAQVPMRVIFSIYSVGFVSLLTYLSDAALLNKAIIPLAVFAELCRIYYSYQAQNKLP